MAGRDDDWLGFSGSVAMLRAAESGYSVGLLEHCCHLNGRSSGDVVPRWPSDRPL
jgi:hypothetical protein